MNEGYQVDPCSKLVSMRSPCNLSVKSVSFPFPLPVSGFSSSGFMDDNVIDGTADTGVFSSSFGSIGFSSVFVGSGTIDVDGTGVVTIGGSVVTTDVCVCCEGVGDGTRVRGTLGELSRLLFLVGLSPRLMDINSCSVGSMA